jgi:hypothetical protein
MTERKASRDEYFSLMFPNVDSSSSLRKIFLSSFFHTLIDWDGKEFIFEETKIGNLFNALALVFQFSISG